MHTDVVRDSDPAAAKANSRAGSVSRNLYAQVLAGLVVGVVIGVLRPSWGEALRPLGDGFLKLVRMLLAPIIFGTIVVGIAKMGSLKEVGRVGFRALVYFEVVSTAALAIGLIVVNLVRPGAGMNVDPATLDPAAVTAYTASGKQPGAIGSVGFVGFVLDVIPTSIVDALARGHMLQIIFFAVLFGLGLAGLPNRGKPVVDLLGTMLDALFAVVRMVMRLAPLATLGAMAFTVGKYGFGTLAALGRLVAAVYLTSVAFIVIVLGFIAHLSGFSLRRFVVHFKEEIAVVFATSSTEVVLPRMMAKLERLGCPKPLAEMVLPIAYAFNADGTAIYLTMASIFVAQATNTQLSLGDQLLVLGVLLLTSKGSAGVAGAGFVTLAATLSSLDKIPVAGIVLLLGVDRFINEVRAVTNVIGNGVATIAIARWEGTLDRAHAAAMFDEDPGGLEHASRASAAPVTAPASAPHRRE